MTISQLRDGIDAVAKLMAIVVGLFAFVQFSASRERDRTQVAIEAVTNIKTPEIIAALVRLDDHYEKNELDYDGIRFDIALVMSWYDHLAMLYLNDTVANRCIIQGGVKPYVGSIQRVLTELEYPRERQASFELLVNRIRDDGCE